MRFRTLVLLLALGACAAPASNTAAPPAAAPSARAQLAFVGGTVVTAPGAEPIRDAVVLVDGRRVVAVGPRASTPVPPGAEVVACEGKLVLAGFWNAHVHLMEPAFEKAASAPAAQLEAALDEMLTRWGFVHVVDTGSFLENTVALRRRVEAGEIRGPSILTAGGTFIPVGGQPVYIPFPLPELADPVQARHAVRAVLDGGADGIKLMTAPVVAHPPPPVMPLEVVRAVTAEAHARGAFVVAHPTNADGVRVAVEGGVDMLAHTAPEAGPWSPEELARMRAAGIALTPTLKLWRYDVKKADIAERFEVTAMAQARAFAAAGGPILFGTDVGYMRDHDPGDEYALLAKAGFGFPQVLAMLTTTPAARFGKGAVHGRIAVGDDADLVVLDGDPARDAKAWTRVRYAVRAGRLVHGAR